MSGKDKGWVDLAGKPMVERVLQRLSPQVDEVLINANRNLKRYQALNQTLVEDIITGYQGPLVGILSAMTICENEFIVCVPCDCPFFPTDLVQRMQRVQRATDADIVSVTDGTRVHPVFALIKTDLISSLNDYLAANQRKIDLWYQQHNYHLVNYSDAKHCFDNINTEQQLNESKRRIAKAGLNE